MPKDAKKNIDRYKIQGGDLNEFEFQQNQAQVKEPVFGGMKSATPGKGAMPKPTAKTSAAKNSAAKKSTAKKSATKKKPKK